MGYGRAEFPASARQLSRRIGGNGSGGGGGSGIEDGRGPLAAIRRACTGECTSSQPERSRGGPLPRCRRRRLGQPGGRGAGRCAIAARRSPSELVRQQRRDLNAMAARRLGMLAVQRAARGRCLSDSPPSLLRVMHVQGGGRGVDSSGMGGGGGFREVGSTP